MDEPIPVPQRPEDLPHLLVSAADNLDRHQLLEAEARYQMILLSLQGTDIHVDNHDKLFIQALGGLGEVHFKKGRTSRGDDLEWHYQMLSSYALQNEILRRCQFLDKKTQNMSEKERRKWYWVEDNMTKASQELGVIDKLVLESFERRIAVNKVKGWKEHVSLFDETGWLKRLETYIYSKNSALKRLNSFSSTQDVSDNDSETSDKSDSDSKTLEATSPTIDCSRVQKTIMTLVRQISKDMRQRYNRKRLSQEMFRTSMSSEMIAQFAPMPETRDILTIFENAIIKYNYGMSADEFKSYHSDMAALEVKPNMPADRTASTESDDEDRGDNGSEALNDEDNSDDQSVSVPLEVDCFGTSKIVTIWKAFGSQNSSPNRKMNPYVMPSFIQDFEEVSALTNQVCSELNHSGKKVLSPSQEDGSPPTGSEQHSYLTTAKLKHSLALNLIKCAQRFQNDDRINHASDLFIYALGIIQGGHCDKFNNRQEIMASILKNLGIIRCTQGNICTGDELLQESIELYSSEDSVNNINVAEALTRLADAYMVDHWKQECISEHVMKLVKDQLQHNTALSIDTKCFSDDVSTNSDSDDEDGDSYSVCAYEAIGHYKSALAILGKLRKRKEVHTELYVDVLTKLGDCSLIVADFERAVLCYEEAFYLCQDTLGSVSLTNSAHILSMLGTTNFLLGTHWKAATMFETACLLQQHLYGLLDNFEMAFTLTMQGITYFQMKLYHKCLAMCIKAFDLYVNIYKKEITSVDPLKRWFIVQTLYCIGYTYLTINRNDKALHYLDLSQEMLKNAADTDIDRQQQVKILKVTADIYAGLEMNATALDYYKQALDHSVMLGDEESVTNLQNQLLNRMAGVLVCDKDYSAAANYLEQALDCQKNVETSIKGDMIGTLEQLGRTCILSGDIQRAIECYSESYDACIEAEITAGPEVARTLSTLGTLYHVKGCMQDDNNDMMEYLDSAEQYYRDAIQVCPNSPVCVYYANFLYQQGQFGDSVLSMLSFLHIPNTSNEKYLYFHGPEQAVLPEHLLHDLNDIEEVNLDAMVFAKFLAILCCKQLKLEDDACEYLVSLVSLVHLSTSSIDHMILGYSLLEMGLYMEAAQAFGEAASLVDNKRNAVISQWIAICLWACMTMEMAVYHIWSLHTGTFVDLENARQLPASFYHPEAAEETELDMTTSSGEVDLSNVQSLPEFIDHFEDTQDTNLIVESNNESTTVTSDDEEWIIEEEFTVETPADVLATLMSRQFDQQDSEKVAETHYTTEEVFTEKIPTVISNGTFEAGRSSMDNFTGQTKMWITEQDAILTRVSTSQYTHDTQNDNYSSGLYDRESTVDHHAMSTDANGNGIPSYQQSEEMYCTTQLDMHPTMLKEQNATVIQDTTERSWTVDNKCLPHQVTDPSDERMTPDEQQEEEWEEGWVTTEEVIETPVELLQALMASQAQR